MYNIASERLGVARVYYIVVTVRVRVVCVGDLVGMNPQERERAYL